MMGLRACLPQSPARARPVVVLFLDHGDAGMLYVRCVASTAIPASCTYSAATASTALPGHGRLLEVVGYLGIHQIARCRDASGAPLPLSRL